MWTPAAPARRPNARRTSVGRRSRSTTRCADEYEAALDDLRSRGVEITFEENRQGGVLNGPRAYFHDPDGTVLEFIDLTSYAGSPIVTCLRSAQSYRPSLIAV
jgi:catechol 2,3-dioxygenase-like lactoylglutathione lyase family enzyme